MRSKDRLSKVTPSLSFVTVAVAVGVLLLTPAVVHAGGEGEVPGAGGAAGEAPAPDVQQGEFVMDIFLHAVPAYQAREHVFKSYVESASAGRIQVNLHPRGAIAADEHDAVEMVRTGEMTVTQNGENAFATMFPEIVAIGLPFLVPNPQVGARLLAHDSWYFEEIAKGIYEGSNGELRVVGAHTNSFRHLYANQPIRTPGDLRASNFKLRTLEHPLHMALWRALGAETIAVPTPDRYMALETGMVDGMEGGAASVYGIGAFDILDYMILTGHIWGANIMVVNEDFYQSLPDDLKRVVREGWHNAIWVENPNRAYADIQAMQNIAAEGNTIISLTPEEHQQWRSIALDAARGFIEETAGREFLELTLRAVEEVEAELNAEIDVIETALE